MGGEQLGKTADVWRVENGRRTVGKDSRCLESREWEENSWERQQMTGSENNRHQGPGPRLALHLT